MKNKKKHTRGTNISRMIHIGIGAAIILGSAFLLRQCEDRALEQYRQHITAYTDSQAD